MPSARSCSSGFSAFFRFRLPFRPLIYFAPVLQAAFSAQRPGLSSGASSRGGGSPGGGLEEGESDLSDEDVRDADEGEDSESTHLTLNGDESSGVSRFYLAIPECGVHGDHFHSGRRFLSLPVWLQSAGRFDDIVKGTGEV